MLRDQLYVCDYSNHRVSVFCASTGEFVRCFGGQPRLQTPVGIAFGLHGEVFVTQYEMHRVAVFNKQSGQFVRHFPASGEGEAASAAAAPAAAVGAAGAAVVAATGAAITAPAEGVLSNPYGIVVDGEGNVLIGDYANKVSVLYDDRSQLCQW